MRVFLIVDMKTRDVCRQEGDTIRWVNFLQQGSHTDCFESAIRLLNDANKKSAVIEAYDMEEIKGKCVRRPFYHYVLVARWSVRRIDGQPELVATFDQPKLPVGKGELHVR